MKEDIEHLTRLFSEQFEQTKPAQPFTLFKTVWQDLRWPYLHFRVFDARGRDAMIKVVLRLFLGVSFSEYCLFSADVSQSNYV